MKLFGETKAHGSVTVPGTLVLAVVTAILVAVVLSVKLLNQLPGGMSSAAVWDYVS